MKRLIFCSGSTCPNRFRSLIIPHGLVVPAFLEDVFSRLIGFSTRHFLEVTSFFVYQYVVVRSILPCTQMITNCSNPDKWF
ncbi:hypothetical protein DPMN_053819 [Dreissena polymorpha]|uniref:Uncharacterized protein n=1 Tax=Dreissena polymorpha TaxID=45954 RepID=A0A9D4CNJ0_DREPO|nr:hypothetical protein DPMN_053819 [Dreissena polymorpha]